MEAVINAQLTEIKEGYIKECSLKNKRLIAEITRLLECGTDIEKSQFMSAYRKWELLRLVAEA